MPPERARSGEVEPRAAEAFSLLAPTRIHPLPVTVPSYDVSLYWHPRFREDPPIQWMRGLMIELFQELRKVKAERS